VADYTPESGPVPKGIDLTHGIIRSTYNGRNTTVGEAIVRRLSPHRNGKITAYDQELLLPASAPDTLRELHVLVALYEQQLLPEQKDLLGITTVRFDHALPAHRQWELARVWAHASFTARGLPVELVHHIPGLSGRKHKPHLHALWPVRVLNGATFGAFSDVDRRGKGTPVAG
jgi:hypothetical protein